MIWARHLFIFLILAFCAFHELTTVCNGDVIIETVPVGNAGNPADSRTGIGAVSYDFQIGKYEVTNAQYADFLNHVDPTGSDTFGLYSIRMASRGGITFNNLNAPGTKYLLRSGYENTPVVDVSFFDAMRFANWVNNGQGSGSTETGAYSLLGSLDPNVGLFAVRNPGAVWVIPNRDEWYKAAYHKNSGPNGNYWTYPTKSNTAPYSDQPSGTGSPNSTNVVNYFVNDNLSNGYNDGYAVLGTTVLDSLLNNFNPVGAYSSSSSAYGTFDQGGNAYEWAETSDVPNGRSLMGGSWQTQTTDQISIMSSVTLPPHNQFFDTGFRLAMIPEPGTTGAIAVGIIVLLFRKMNRRDKALN